MTELIECCYAFKTELMGKTGSRIKIMRHVFLHVDLKYPTEAAVMSCCSFSEPTAQQEILSP